MRWPKMNSPCACLVLVFAPKRWRLPYVRAKILSASEFLFRVGAKACAEAARALCAKSAGAGRKARKSRKPNPQKNQRAARENCSSAFQLEKKRLCRADRNHSTERDSGGESDDNERMGFRLVSCRESPGGDVPCRRRTTRCLILSSH